MTGSSHSIAFFDLDHTLVDGDSDTSFIEYLSEHGLLAEEILRAKDPIHDAYLAGEPWQEGYRLLMGRIWGGRDVAEMMSLSVQHAQERVVPMLFPQATRLLREERGRRASLMLLTTTNDAVTGPIAKALGFDGLLSTRLEVADGRYTGALVDGFCTGPGKEAALRAHCAERGVDPSDCAMFGDGRSDMDALAAVGEPVAVHPTPELARWAAESGMRVIDLS